MSALKSATARSNGAKSYGPVTPQGKARSASNSSTHGIFKSPYTLRNENDPVFLQLEAEFNEEWDPQGPTETVLVEQMILCQWRLRRIWAAETAGIDMQMDEDAAELAEAYGEFDEACRTAAAFKHLADGSNFLNLLQRYDTSLSRQFDRALVRLRELQRDRAPEPQPLQPDTTNLQNEPKPVGREEANLQNEPKLAEAEEVKLQNEPKPAHEIRAVLPIDDARRLLAALGYNLNVES